MARQANKNFHQCVTPTSFGVKPDEIGVVHFNGSGYVYNMEEIYSIRTFKGRHMIERKGFGFQEVKEVFLGSDIVLVFSKPMSKSMRGLEALFGD